MHKLRQKRWKSNNLISPPRLTADLHPFSPRLHGAVYTCLHLVPLWALPDAAALSPHRPQLHFPPTAEIRDHRGSIRACLTWHFLVRGLDGFLHSSLPSLSHVRPSVHSVCVVTPESWGLFFFFFFFFKAQFSLCCTVFRFLFAAVNTHILAKILLVCFLHEHNDRLDGFLFFFKSW